MTNTPVAPVSAPVTAAQRPQPRFRRGGNAPIKTGESQQRIADQANAQRQRARPSVAVSAPALSNVPSVTHSIIGQSRRHSAPAARTATATDW